MSSTPPPSIPTEAPSAPPMGDTPLGGLNMNLNAQYFSHIQDVLKGYPLSFVQIGSLIFLIICLILLYFFQERVKAILRGFVRKLLYKTHVNADGTKVETHSRASTDGIYQMLTYLEQTWLAPADRSTMETLPANVELDERYSVAIPPPPGEDKEHAELDNEQNQEVQVVPVVPVDTADENEIIDETRYIVRDL